MDSGYIGQRTLNKELPKSGPKKNVAKIKEGVCVGPEIGEMMLDNEFRSQMDQRHGKPSCRLSRIFLEITELCSAYG